MARLGLIEEDIVLPEKDGFILCDENGVGRVTLLSVIGKGGTAIAYKAIRRRNGSTVTCIVKEYFPEQKEKSGRYKREKTGDRITIAERYREAELQLQRENVRRELQTNQEIYFSEEDIRKMEFNNSPYVYSAEYLCSLGDSSYIALESSEGETLCALLKRRKISGDEAVRFIRQLLVIVEHLSRKGFVHCDIKPENLWIRGKGDNQSMCLLDFGSAFRLSDYQADLSAMNGREVMEAADRIMRNEGIGSNTRGYCSVNITRLESNKMIYDTTDHSPERARMLMDSMNAIGAADDLFSVVKVAGRLLKQAELTEEERDSIRRIWSDAEEKNANMGFRSVPELEKEIEIIDTILHRGAHPAVLERALKKKHQMPEPDEFSRDLLCDI